MILIKTIDLLSGIAGVVLLTWACYAGSWNLAMIGVGTLIAGQAIVFYARLRHGYTGSMLAAFIDSLLGWPFP